MRILVVDDDRRLALSVKRGLEAEGFAVDVAHDGDEALWSIGENDYDAMILDVMLPGIDGLELSARLRREGNWTPILILTAKDADGDQARALDIGADDFLAKPFSYVVLTARLRALLRRGGAGRPPVLAVGDLRLDPALHRMWRGETEIELTPRQFSLLEFLMRRPGEVIPKKVILDHVWDFDFEGAPNIVEVYIRQLRLRIDEPFGRSALQTVRLVGYRLAEDGG